MQPRASTRSRMPRTFTPPIWPDTAISMAGRPSITAGGAFWGPPGGCGGAGELGAQIDLGHAVHHDAAHQRTALRIRQAEAVLVPPARGATHEGPHLGGGQHVGDLTHRRR